jgi:CubicO group peptidase (beta-lactamase class C family)
MGAALSAALALGACAHREAAEHVVAPSAHSDVRIDDARIDATLRSFVDAGSIAGVSALVFQNGEEQYFGAFGMADREAGRAMARKTIATIFSMTKPVAGVALMQQYEQGKFQLDDPIAQYLPEFASLRVYVGQDANDQPIYEATVRAPTIRDFMRHTAGLTAGNGDQTPVGAIYREIDPRNRDNTLAQVTQELGQIPLAYQPGTRWLYSDSVDVQARLVEVFSGEPFDQYLQRHIFDPLRMTETGYVVAPENRERWAWTYNRSDAGVLTRAPDDEREFNSQPWPLKPGSYGLTSTLDDYMRFARMLQNEGELDGARILRAESVRLMATSTLADSVTNRSWLPSKGQVGFGIDFAVRVRPPATQAEQSGAVGEFFWDGRASTLFWVDPANDVTAVMFVQLLPFDRIGLHKAFRDAVYAGSSASSANAPAAP